MEGNRICWAAKGVRSLSILHGRMEVSHRTGMSPEISHRRVLPFSVLGHCFSVLGLGILDGQAVLNSDDNQAKVAGSVK